MFNKAFIVNTIARSANTYVNQAIQQSSRRMVTTTTMGSNSTKVQVPKFYTRYTTANTTVNRPMFNNTNNTFRTVNYQGKKAFSTEAAAADATTDKPKAVVENLIAEQKGFVSRALRDEAKAKYENLPISPRKLEYLCRLVRGMSVREALVQLRLCNKRKAYYLRRGIRTTANGAVNTFNMMKDRLVVDEIYATKGQYYKRLHIRARGRANLRVRRKSHLVIKLKEQPYHKGEFRIGRYGRTIEHWKRVDRLSDAWKLKRAEEAA